MANKPFDREVINQRERPLSSDVNTGWSYADKTSRFVADAISQRRASTLGDPAALPPLTGFIGDGFRVKATSPASMQVLVSSGLGYVVDAALNATNIGSALTPGVLGVDDDQRMHPLPLSAEQTISVPAAHPVNPRIDIVEVKLDRRLQDPTSRQVLDTGTGLFSALTVNKTLAFDLDGRTGVNTTGGNSTTGIAYKTGTPAGSPSAPGTSSGYLKIAEVLVDGAAASIAQNKIKDLRPPLWPHGTMPFDVTFDLTNTGTSTGATGALPPGMNVTVQPTSAPGALGSVYLFVHDTSAVVLPTAHATIGTVFGSFLPATSLFVPRLFLTTGVANAALVSAMAAATPSIAIAEGQPYHVIAYVIGEVTNGGAVANATNLPANFKLHLSGALLRAS